MAAFEFSMKVIEKTELLSKLTSSMGEEGRDGQSPAAIEISILAIEILNCTFHPKPLYQRYIQVVVRAILEAIVGRSSFVVGQTPVV